MKNICKISRGLEPILLINLTDEEILQRVVTVFENTFNTTFDLTQITSTTVFINELYGMLLSVKGRRKKKIIGQYATPHN